MIFRKARTLGNLLRNLSILPEINAKLDRLGTSKRDSTGSITDLPFPDRLAAVRKVQEDLERDVYKAPWPAADLEWYRYASRVQSMIFYMDMLPYLRRALSRIPRGTPLRLLDVGAATGAGSDLYGLIFRTQFTGYRIEVDALDIIEQFKPMSDVTNRHINYIIGDVYAVPSSSYDLVICSHTIEHVGNDNLSRFIEKVSSIASRSAIFYAPFEEQNLISGHPCRITDEYVRSLDPSWMDVTESLAWRHPVDEQSRCVMFGFDKEPAA